MEPLRQAQCAGCTRIFFVCRRCERGQIYCSPECREQGRRRAHSRANARHQASEEGRLDHRDRQRAYVARRRAMTDTGSKDLAKRSKVCGAAEPMLPTNGSLEHSAKELLHVLDDDRTNCAQRQSDPDPGDGHHRKRGAEGAPSTGASDASHRGSSASRVDCALLQRTYPCCVCLRTTKRPCSLWVFRTALASGSTRFITRSNSARRRSAGTARSVASATFVTCAG